MLSKAKIKYLNTLKSKKYRQKYNNFVAEGDKIGQEILKQPVFNIEGIYALPEWIATQHNNLKGLNTEILEVSPAELKKISFLQTPNQVFFVLKNNTRQLDIDTLNQDLFLLLDRIQDPGNLGTILRIADWFGIKNVICSPDSVEVFNPKVIQASMGAFLRVNTFTHDLENLCEALPNTPIYGAVLGGNNLFKTPLSSKSGIVIGNESQGISSELQERLTHRIEIPNNGGAESLNAAIATGIICAVFRNL